MLTYFKQYLKYKYTIGMYRYDLIYRVLTASPLYFIRPFYTDFEKNLSLHILLTMNIDINIFCSND